MPTHLRTAAVVCVLSIGFAVSGAGAGLASADPQAGDPQNGTGNDGYAGPPANPDDTSGGTIADNVRKAIENSIQGTVQTVTGTLNAVTGPGQVPSSIPDSPKTTFGGSPTVYGTLDPSAPPADDKPVVPVVPPSITPFSVAAPAVLPSGSSPPPPAAPAPKPPAPSTPPVPPGLVVKNPLAAVTTVVAPVTTAFGTVAARIAAVQGVVAGLPTSGTALSDLLIYFQSVMTSVGDAGNSLSQLPNDLAGLLGVHVPAPTATIGAATSRLPGLAAAAHPAAVPPLWSPGPQLPALFGVDRAPTTDVVRTTATPVNVAMVGAISGESTSAATPLIANRDGKNDVLSTVEHVIGAVVATVSLTALAAIAIPGILGLLSTCAAGIRVGYRQAKAASSLPDTAIARFVGTGPVGVVRSSSQVALRSSATRIGRPAARATGRIRALRVVGSTSTTQLLEKAG